MYHGSMNSNPSTQASAPEHHQVQLKDVRMRYIRAGEGDPVILLHGWPQTSASWKYILPVLAEKYTVIAPDLRGLGDSTKPDSGYDTNTLATDIHELVEALGFDKIFIAGHDWGGATAYSYASLFRDEVRRLSIFEMVLPGFGLMEGAMIPKPGGEFLWHMGLQSVPDIAYLLIDGKEDPYLRWFFRHHAYDPTSFTEEEVQEYVRALKYVGSLRAGLEIYKSYWESAAQNEEHRKQPLTIPVSAWAGDSCLGTLTKECLDQTAENVIGGTIERCGHWIGEERPDFVASHLLEFFGEES
jgi:pimeloyl-ACP methyl ester carboxylesterase